MKLKRFILIVTIGLACQKTESPKTVQRSNEHRSPNTICIERTRLATMELGLYQVARKPLRYELKIPADVFASPNSESFVGANISGRIQKLLVNENDAIRNGAPLAVLESATIANLVADLRESVAVFALAEADYKRKQKIASENILSEKVLLESESALRIAEARLFAAESRCLGAGFSKDDLDRIKAKPDSAVTHVLIRSNLTGILAKRFATLGEYVEPSKPLFQVIRLDEVMLVGNVFEPEFGRVRVGQSVEVRFGAFHSEKFFGTIHSVGAVVNETTHALPVRVVMRNPNHRLKPSMHAEMTIAIESESPQLLIPTRAISIDGEMRTVFVQKSDSVFEARHIKIFEETREFTAVAEGISEGERVATENLFFLKSQWKANELAED